MRTGLFRTGLLVMSLNFGFISCDNSTEKEEAIETDPIVFNKEAEVYLMHSNGDTLRRIDVELAESDYEKQTGLMYRESLEREQGMLFVYESARVRNFYMKNTYIPLDILYYGTDSTLVSIQKNATPRDETNLPSDGPAQFVLEINAGLADEWGVTSRSTFSVVRD
ncbi:hypothetical protein JM79_0794 [Gramella sp. Hel_I_59]|uniref:DUF192 domain-containing protein n=1 Tax=Gramella sp. Hel_I_59 TaxID=1249978 RepID=UPI0011535BF5|nr:DUF192 domain-containing protein [Gramella sp. Hel_I_59]TQI69901.1 hypothetical protein JM79_0794 [Gramella sp. Hel_I_59]